MKNKAAQQKAKEVLLNRDVKNQLNTFQIFLAYEVKSSWWAGRIPFLWVQKLSAKYFHWKTFRKFKRYIK